MNAALEGVPRPIRRRLLAAEQAARASGNWGSWEKADLMRAAPGNFAAAKGWARECTHIHKNRAFAVLVRPIPQTPGVEHFGVSSLSGIRPTWWEMQRIKDELAGPEATAVEIYPPAAQIVDEADMFHIWILPAPLPFGLPR